MKDLAVKKLKQIINTTLDNIIQLLNKDISSITDNELINITDLLDKGEGGIYALRRYFEDLNCNGDLLNQRLETAIESDNEGE